jgi:expansin (peptidoglycan-binding protein)
MRFAKQTHKTTWVQLMTMVKTDYFTFFDVSSGGSGFKIRLTRVHGQVKKGASAMI